MYIKFIIAAFCLFLNVQQCVVIVMPSSLVLYRKDQRKPFPIETIIVSLNPTFYDKSGAAESR